MTQHFTRNTVSADFYCSKCGKFTQHRIDRGRKGPCLDCIAKLDALHQNAPKDRQKSLFGEAT
jgi:ribosomal protein L44E